MSLTPEIEALLSKVTDPTKREGLRKQFEDPSLGDFSKELSASVLRQSDYSRKMNELNESIRTQADAYGKGISWVEEKKSQYAEAMKRLKDAEDRAAALEKSSAGIPGSIPPAQDFNLNMQDEAQVAQAIKMANERAAEARKFADELASRIQKIDGMLERGELVTASQFQQEAAKQLDAYSRATMDVIGVMGRAKTEYGLDLDRDKLLNETAKLGGDLNRAYDVLTADARMKRETDRIREEVKQELEAKYQNTVGNPLASGQPTMIGPLQARVDAVANPESTIDPNIPADGSFRLARAIAAELRAEGKY